MRLVDPLSLLGVLLLQPVWRVNASTIHVPGDFPTIASAVNGAAPGDVILIAPGTYFENNILIRKPLVISSQWLDTGDTQFISQTVIEGSGSTVFETVHGQGIDVEISGLTFVNSRKPIVIHDAATIRNNIFSGNESDGISFEAEGHGYAGFNTIEDCGDDGIDVDSKTGAFVIEHNIVRSNHDDGIEIRLFGNNDPGMQYDIHDNILSGNGEDGIQLIDETADDTGRVFFIYRNVLDRNADAGLGSMANGNTHENFAGSNMKERVVFYNNTVTRNTVGVTGADNFIAINNIIADNLNEGLKRFRIGSVAAHSILSNNGTHLSDVITGDDVILDLDPQYDPNTYELLPGSPSIDAGVAHFEWQGEVVLDLAPTEFNALAPDLGAKEFGDGDNTQNRAPSVTAGTDQVLFAPSDSTILEGQVSDDGLPNGSLMSLWRMTAGPGTVVFADATDPATTASFSVQGKYRLRLTADDGELTASDSVTIRYANDGNGDFLFAPTTGTTVFEAEDFAYLYGTAQVIGDPAATMQAAVEAPAGMGTTAFTEHTLLVAGQDVTFYVWVRGKGFGENSNSLLISFEGGAEQTVTFATNAAYSWSKMPGSFVTPAGTWPLIIRAGGDGVIWDQVVFTTDPNFVASRRTIQISVISTTDDAEESDTGSMYMTSSDLELVEAGSRGNQVVGIRFTGVDIPRDAVIENAYIQFTVDEAGAVAPGNKAIYGEAADDAPTFAQVSHNISSRARTTAMVLWDPPVWIKKGEAGPDQRTSNLKAIVQEIVDRPGWEPGNSIAFIIEGTGKRVAESFDGTAPPVLVVDFGRGETIRVAVEVNSSSDDAEESDSAGIYLSSSDLELVRDGSSRGDQIIGTRFTGVNVPGGAIIRDAYIQFTVDESGSGDNVSGVKTIYGEAVDDASTFVQATGNVSLRPRTAATVDWDPPEWNAVGESGPAQRTPNLKEIVQEIVDRPNWSSGNSLAFIIEGTGKRVAGSFDGGAPPVLVIEFDPSGLVPTEPEMSAVADDTQEM